MTDKKKSGYVGNQNAQRGDSPLDATIVLRCTGEQKGAFVQAAREKGQKLSAWMIEAGLERLERDRSEETDDD